MPAWASLDQIMRLIWQTTLVLVAIGLLLMTGLVLHRLLEEWRDRRHRTARETLRRSLLAELNTGTAGATPVAAPAAQAGGLPIAETARLVDELAQIVRGEARLRLAAFAAAAGVERHWLKRLGSPLARYRHEAARCVGLLDTPQARAALETCLAAADVRLRLAAAEALAGRPALAAGLVDRLLEDPAAGGRHAARFWHRIATTAPGELAARLAAGAHQPELLCRMIEALGDSGHLAAAGPIEVLVGRHGESVDRTSLVALQRLQHPAMLRVARRLARSFEPDTRRAAMAVLLERGRPQDLQLARSLADDPVAEIRAAAAAFIERVTAPSTTGAASA